jgi:hypothetical protein
LPWNLVPEQLARVLILPQTEENWLTQPIVPSPLREFYLADHHRHYPTAPLHFGGGQPRIKPAPGCRKIIEWAVFDGDLVKLSRKQFQESFAETCTDPTSKFKFATFINADQQRSQMLPFAGGLGIAANHK